MIDDRIDLAAFEGSVTFRSAHETADCEVIPVAVHAGHVTYRGEEVILPVARDVSDLEKRECELDRYRQAVEGSTDALSAVDRDCQFFFANPVYRKIHGIDGDTSIRGRHLADVLDTDTWEQIQPRLDRAMEGETVEFEMTRSDSEGAERIFDLQYFPIESGDGTIFGVGASMRDITADRSRTDALRQLSEYRRVISAVNHELVRADSTQELLPEVVNALSSSGQFGCTYLAVVDDEGEPAFLAKSDAGMTESSVWEFHTPSYLERVFEAGSLQMVDVTQEPFEHHDGDEPSHAGVAIAITYESEELGVLTVHLPPEEELEEVGFRLLDQLADDLGLFLHSQSLEQELRTCKEFAERIDAPVMLQSLDGTFEVVNEALGDYAAEDPAELIGEDEFAFMDEESAETVQEMKERVHEVEEPIRYEVRPTLQGKGERIFSTIRYPHYDEGELDGTMAICRDVTDLKERERQLRVMDRVLRHNVNNNMTVVEGYAETIRGMVDDPVASSYASKIVENSNALVATVQKEREISKILSDPPPKGTFDLVPVVESAIDDVRDTEPEAHITSHLPDECQVTATQAIGQAIEELVRNAVRHSDLAQPSVEVRVTEGAEYVRVAVEDDGPGIPTMEQRVLTGEAEIEPLYYGSGLGLWLVNLIFQYSDGQLSFDENEPRGSVVTVELPRS